MWSVDYEEQRKGDGRNLGDVVRITWREEKQMMMKGLESSATTGKEL